MKIVVIGATGTIGSAVVKALSAKHEVVAASRKGGRPIDISEPHSIAAFFKSVGEIDAIVSTAGSARFKPFAQLTEDDFEFSLRNKLMGQVNVVRIGLPHVKASGSITLTSGVLGKNPIIGSGAISLVNAGLEGFIRAAALEAPRGIRVNIVSPPWVTETLEMMKMDPKHGTPAVEVAKAYVSAVEGNQTGQVIDATK